MDTIRYSTLVRQAAALKQGGIAYASPSRSARLSKLCDAYRLACDSPLSKMIASSIEKYPTEDVRRFLLKDKATLDYLRSKTNVDRTIVLKAPGPGDEKGVILLMGESNWLRLFITDNIEHIDKKFHVVLSSAWAPTDYKLLALGLSVLRSPIFMQSCNYNELDQLRRFNDRIICLPTIGCDWINPAFYQPKPINERQFDIVMVANWAPFKRHWHFFKALSQMREDLRIVMIGQDERGYTEQHVREQAKLFGVKQQILFRKHLSISEVSAYQCDSKIALIFSRHEGCCVAVAESLFANTPVGMLANAEMGPSAYINDQTGVMLHSDARAMARQLTEFLANAHRYNARQWATDNISCFKSAGKVNEVLRQTSQSMGTPWTHDLRTPCWRPYPQYIEPADVEALAPVYEDLNRRYPQVFGSDLLDSACSPNLRKARAEASAMRNVG